MTLRPYQADLKGEVRHAWAQGARVVVMRLDTGGGKTIILGDIVREHPGASAVIAHRQELVGQLSLALARAGVRHNIVAAQATRRAIAASHMVELGASFYDPGARCAVASIDTLIRADGLSAWAAQVTLWITDEGHHVVRDNKWHRGLELFTHPLCHGLLPTATPSRADGKGLGAHADGVAHTMVQGPPMRWLIEQGYLTDYRMVCVESDLVAMLEDAAVGSTGDYSTAQLRTASRKSHIVGDVVGEYQKWASGLLGITFSSDVETAVEITQAYRAAGVRAETLTGKTEDGMRRQMLRRFANRELDKLVVVDIVSEGFDLPAVQMGSFARKTESLATYMQQFGRMLRPIYAPGHDLNTQAGRLAAIAASAKPVALIIDHVNNFLRHGPPDRPRLWTLDRRERRGGGGDGIPLRVCTGCWQPYERTHPACPYCGHVEPVEPVARTSPAMVDGDLTELDAETLARLRGAVEALDMDAEAYRTRLVASGLHGVGVMANVKRHAEAQDAQGRLREAMALWGGARKAEGLTDRQMQRRFWHEFGVDVLTARALKTRDADALYARLTEASVMGQEGT